MIWTAERPSIYSQDNFTSVKACAIRKGIHAAMACRSQSARGYGSDLMLFRNAGSRPGVWTMRVGATLAGLAFLVAAAPEGRAAPVTTDGCTGINAGGFDGVATGAQMSDTR